MKNLGIYIHIPFCRSRCVYCNFYSSVPGSDEILFAYCAALLSRLKKYSQRFSGHIVDSVYFGGGTPTVLGAERLSQILEETRKNFRVSKEAELSLEANPNSVDLKSLDLLKRAGFNRISFGAQSAVRKELAALGRTHGAEEAARAVGAARKAGFENISADMMLGIPFQTGESLADSLRFFAGLGVEHISAYMLKLEKGTRLYEKRRSFPFADDDGQADFYLQTVAYLEKAGYKQYEISNFTRPGFESRHNLKYWNCDEYLGLGASAHSFFGGGRFFYPDSLDGFIKSPAIEFGGNGGSLEEYVMLRLRLASGLDFEKAGAFGLTQVQKSTIIKIAGELEKYGLCRRDGKGVALTVNGFLLSNYCTGKILEAL
ncbi:MAG: radical SAM family heme chaperone HemW [Oscillospiraceae bacterium]|jgi:oxygen-independent coproporphyrinogen-3 oxidase|nr:radical SAM family heme chaperone HemW [Oscillospiraceae bacterium]